MSVRAVVLMAFVLGSLPFCLVRPFYGIVLWTIIGFLNPQAFIWQWNDFPWAQAVALPTIAGAAIFARGWTRRLATREFYLVVALWIWFSISTVASIHTPAFMHHADDTLAGWKFVSKILLMCILTMAVIDGIQRLRIMLLAVAGCFGVFAVKALPFMVATGGAHRIYGPAKSMIADNNDLGLALNMTLPLFFFLAQAEYRPWVKTMFKTLFVITIPTILFTYSRGALVGLVAVMGMIFLEFKHRLLLLPILILGAVAVVAFAPESWKERMNPSGESVLDRSAQGRLNAWAFSWNLALDYPVAGGGFDTFSSELFDRYAPDARDWHGPHSVYFQVLAEHGFIGAGLFLALVLSCFMTTYRLVSLARRHQDDTIVNYAKALRVSLVGFLASGLFLGRAYFDYFYTVVACLAILHRAYTVALREAGTEEAEDEDENEDGEAVMA